MTALLLVMVGLANVAAFAGARIVTARALGVSGLQARLGIEHGPWAGVSFTRRASFAAVGFFACYFVAAATFMVGDLAAGRDDVDDTSMHVVVAKGGPADLAGIRDGDRVETVEGQAVGDWPSLRAEVSKHPGAPVRVVIQRDGTEMTFTPTSTSSGKIGLISPSTHTSIGMGVALVDGIAGPLRVWIAVLRGAARIIAGSEHAETMSGPVAIVSATRQAPGGQAIRYVAALNAYFLWAPIVLAIVVFPRSRRRA